MLVLLSPARNIREADHPHLKPRPPLFSREAQTIVEAVRQYSPWELESLLEVSQQRALELYDDYQGFHREAEGSPALVAYHGAAFKHLNPADFDWADCAFAEKTLRIFSALYGLVRPGDGILPHRLGLSKEFAVEGRNLYQFWGDRLYRELFREGETVVSLTSADYAKLVTPYMQRGDQLLTCRFLVMKPGGPRGTVSTVRVARGQMARYIVKNRVTDPAALKDFSWEGYQFSPSHSTWQTYVFIQDRSAYN